MATAQQRRILAEAVKNGTDTNLAVVAFQASLVDGIDIESPEALMTPSVLIKPVMNPVLDAKLAIAGARKLSDMTYSMGLGDNYTDGPMRIATYDVQTGLVWPERLTKTDRGPRDLTTGSAHRKLVGLTDELGGTPAGTYVRANIRFYGGNAPMDAAITGVLGLSASATNLYLKAFTHFTQVPEHLPQVALNLHPAGRPSLDPRPVLATHAVAALDWLEQSGAIIVEEGEPGWLNVLRERVSQSVIAYPTPGAPALAEVSVGSKARIFVNMGAPQPDEGETATRTQMLAEEVEAELRKVPVVPNHIHPSTRDAGRLALAEPFDDPRLRGYQQTAVGRHAVTEVGYLLATSPGTGKTVMSASGMRERAKDIAGYRGLVVVEANVRAQWGPEVQKWFPTANVVTIASSKDSAKLVDALEDAGDDPLVVILSYSLLASVHKEIQNRAEETVARSEERFFSFPVIDELGQMALFAVPGEEPIENLDHLVEEHDKDESPRGLGALLLDTHWHDLIADEAEVLRSTGSKQASALWELRNNSDVAVALTGTPINRGIDDLGRLLSWCRGDADLFRGVKLSKQYDLAESADLDRLHRNMGAVMFRIDTSEVSDEMPTIDAVVMKLSPSAPEKALADAARRELKRVYDELVEAISHAEELDADNPAYAQARSALKAARGAHLGGTTLARMASSDPAALLGSTSAGAALLAGQGLVAAATQVTGTKRQAVVADTIERVSNGEAVLIFTEFATVARGLIDDLDAAGVKVGEILGGGGAARDRMITEFQNGELDVMVATSSGERGLNLQRASTIVHYDLPWAPKGVVQRTGRALRLESSNQKVTLVFPLMEGTVEERVAATVVTRALEAMYALDKSRGVDISKTEIGMALGGLAASLGDTATGRAVGGDLLALTRELVAQ